MDPKQKETKGLDAEIVERGPCDKKMRQATQRPTIGKRVLGVSQGREGYPSDSHSEFRREGGVGNSEQNETVTESMRGKERIHGIHIHCSLGTL